MFSHYRVHMPNPTGGRAADIVIRPYQEADRLLVRRICADTGYLGQPIDPIFEDRELFVDYLTDYYLRVEPDASLVCEADGEVKGYLLGCCRPLVNQTYRALTNLSVAARAFYRCFTRPYGPESRAFLRWVAVNAWREMPAAPRFTPHFHINLLNDARSLRHTRLLIQAFLELLYSRGHKEVYGQMVTYEARRTASLFARYGFHVMDRVELTKYKRTYPGRVFLTTLVRDLQSGPALVSIPRRLRRNPKLAGED
jgi:L-amino acid N-acyltransferase YncA